MLLLLVALIATIIVLVKFTNIRSLNFDLLIGGMILMNFVNTFAELLGLIGGILYIDEP